MSSPLIRGRGRNVATLTATASLIVGTAALTAATTAPAQSAGAGCAEPAKVSTLADGAPVTSLTVSDGTTPDTLEGEVLGVLDNGIAPDLDMVIVDFSGNPEIDTPTGPGGIWQGMSGSPVYDNQDKLIGAVAYGMAWGPSPIAGVTPFEEMDNYLSDGWPAPARVEVGKGMARKIAANSDLSAAQAEQGLRQLRMPMGVSGLSPERLAKATTKLRKYLPKSTYVGSTPSAQAAGPDTIVDGGNLAASVSYGDITQAGVGTATDVCAGEVVGFGHPMTFGGKTTMSMHPADAIYIQADPVGAPFKVANLGDPAGIIDEDHLTGISGVFGAAPEFAEITSTVTYGTRNREGSSKVTVTDFAPGTTFYQQLANHDRVVDAITGGSEAQSWTIEGTDSHGAPFTLSSGDRFVSDFDISFQASFDLADIVYLLTSVPGLTIESVSVDGVVSDDTGRYQVTGMEQFKQGHWTRVSRRNPATVRAGKILKLRAVLTSSDGPSLRVPFEFKVNKRLGGARGFLYLTGGNDYFSEDSYYELYDGSTSLDDVEDLLAKQLRNDEIQAALRFFAEGSGGGECRGCKANGSVSKDLVLGPVDQVVGGFKQIKVLVKR